MRKLSERKTQNSGLQICSRLYPLKNKTSSLTARRSFYVLRFTFYFPSLFLIAAVNAGTITNKSPTTP
jgi:hypothetical protein